MNERKTIYLDDAIDAVAEGLKRTFVEYRDVAEKMLNKVPSAEPIQTDKDFEKQIHAMFDHIWDCEIEHPIFQDTVGELMKAVIQAHNNSAQPHTEEEIQKIQDLEQAELEKVFELGREDALSEIIRCKDCKHWLDIDDGRQKHRMCADVYGEWFCADAERREDG